MRFKLVPAQIGAADSLIFIYDSQITDTYYIGPNSQKTTKLDARGRVQLKNFQRWKFHSVLFSSETRTNPSQLSRTENQTELSYAYIPENDGKQLSTKSVG